MVTIKPSKPSKKVPIDPASPVPLYHQIAEEIRARIEAGELAPGDALEPLRQAAETWKVHLHTVRHAYAALVREGLVESRRGRGGTRVVGSPEPRVQEPAVGLREWVAGVAAEGADRYAVTPAEIAAVLVGRDSGPESESLPRVFVVECSPWQCETHALEIRERFAVDAQPWTLDGGEPPDGDVISTYFHYNDVRREWPRRLASFRFVTIHPDPRLLEQVAGSARLVVAERDASTVEAVTADLVGLFPDGDVSIEPFVSTDPVAALAEPDDAPVLFAPRVWAELPDSARKNRRAFELRYVFDRDELGALARTLGWKPRRGVAA